MSGTTATRPTNSNHRLVFNTFDFLSDSSEVQRTFMFEQQIAQQDMTALAAVAELEMERLDKQKALQANATRCSDFYGAGG